MKVVIFAGGTGTRLSEETTRIPKPMVEIGGRPILWHIMKIYSHYGYNDFIICCGYKGYLIKEYFANYYNHNSDLTVDLSNNDITYHNTPRENWNVTLIDTGLETLTANRLLKVKKLLKNEETFMLTYGDGVGNIDIEQLVHFHKKHKKIATVTSVQPQGRFGTLTMDHLNCVTSYQEKISDSNTLVNAGFFVLNKEIFEQIELACYMRDLSNVDFNKKCKFQDLPVACEVQVMFEQDPLTSLVLSNQLMSYRHEGFWMPMDTLKDKGILEQMWNNNQAKWKVW